MIHKILLIYCMVMIAASHPGGKQVCVLQELMSMVINAWVDEDGRLANDLPSELSVDLAAHLEAVPILSNLILDETRSIEKRNVRFLSLARCKLNRVPFLFKSPKAKNLTSGLQYLSLFGNNFREMRKVRNYNVYMNATQAQEATLPFRNNKFDMPAWYTGLQSAIFSSLLELDLRSCKIQVMNDNIFEGMPQLQALYLSDNRITQIYDHAFGGLKSLVHLDLSNNRNEIKTTDSENIQLTFGRNIFSNLETLTSLDLSNTKIAEDNVAVLKGLGKNLQILSLCSTNIRKLESRMFVKTSIKYLDLSWNHGILYEHKVLNGLENTLRIFYGEAIGLTDFGTFTDFTELVALVLERNEITQITSYVPETLTNIIALNLNQNRLSLWLKPTFSLIPNLNELWLEENNINFITPVILEDLKNISYISLARNTLACSCELEKFYQTNDVHQKSGNYSGRDYRAEVYNLTNFIRDHINRNRVNDNDTGVEIISDLEITETFNFKMSITIKNLRDIFYKTNSDIMMCLNVHNGTMTSLSDINECDKSRSSLDDEIGYTKRALIPLIVIPAVLLPALVLFSYMYRKNLWYCYINLRNSAALGSISYERQDDEKIYIYDVFVSYCHEDRDWVLDHLIPNMEKEYNVSVCLHERDFQVGLSILENIVCSMDRSRCIMLLLSRKFLNSQWCKFEMHLAQHRLLETRREDLVLILLEDIPRSLRPNTLHYLMLTKTYILWPSSENEQKIFWQRLKRSVVRKNEEKISFA